MITTAHRAVHVLVFPVIETSRSLSIQRGLPRGCPELENEVGVTLARNASHGERVDGAASMLEALHDEVLLAHHHSESNRLEAWAHFIAVCRHARRVPQQRACRVESPHEAGNLQERKERRTVAALVVGCGQQLCCVLHKTHDHADEGRLPDPRARVHRNPFPRVAHGPFQRDRRTLLRLPLSRFFAALVSITVLIVIAVTIQYDVITEKDGLSVGCHTAKVENGIPGGGHAPRAVISSVATLLEAERDAVQMLRLHTRAEHRRPLFAALVTVVGGCHALGAIEGKE